MLAFFVSVLLQLLAWLPSRALRLFRRLRLRRRGMITLRLDERLPGPALAAALDELDRVAEERLARGVLLRLGAAPIGWASAQAVHAALLRLRRAGLLVVVQLDAATNGTLLVASAADRVWLAPAADATLHGVGAELTFYGDALARLGLRAEVVAAGAYKSAGEPFSRAFPTPESRTAMRELVEDLQGQLVSALAAARRVPEERVLDWLASTPMAPARALREGMVDGLAYEDEVDRGVEELLGAPPRWAPLGRHARWRRVQAWLDELGRQRPLIAVVHLEGPVVALEETAGPATHIDAERVVPTLAQLAEAENVAGVVLYVQSPGGGAQASDDIARAVALLAREKPVVAVLGDVAASGGYYIAAPAAEIVAGPGTVTGSIGVIGGKLVIAEALGRVGVHTERVSAGPDGGMFGPWEPFTPAQRERFAGSLARFYERFLAVVAAGRRRPVRAVEPFAQGRVWTGRQALARGLVDHLGDITLGVERVAALASLPPREARVVHLAFPVSRLAILARTLRGEDTVLPGLGSLGRLAGAALAIPRALARAPGAALAILPWRVDGAGD